MKRLLTIIFILSLSRIIFGQTAFNVSFDQTTDTVEAQGDWAYFNTELTNPSDLHTVNVKVSIVERELAFGWSLILCPEAGCLNASDTTTTVIIPPLGSTDLEVQVNTDVMAIEEGSFILRFENSGDPLDFVDVEMNVAYVPFVAPSGIDEVGNERQKLSQNYPNPFSEVTTIGWHGVENDAQLVVQDMLGKVISIYSITKTEGTMTLGNEWTPGLYFYSLQEKGKWIETKQFIVVDRVANSP